MEYVIAGGAAALLIWLGRITHFAWWLAKCDVILAELLEIDVERAHIIILEMKPQLRDAYKRGATPRTAANTLVLVMINVLRRRKAS